MGVIFRPYESKGNRRIKLKEKLDRLKFIEERNLYEGSLFEFVKAAWSSIDSSEFKSNWAIEAFCDHLECVTMGLAPRLLANYPPRASKTTIASICWPAWTWARQEISFTSGPQVRFLCGSYNEKLAFLNANKGRRLILSPFYQKYWGDRFDLTADQNNKTQFDNTKGGSRLATSVGGSLLGLGGDVICFPRWQKVQTELGALEIGDIVDRRLAIRAWSYNRATGELELKPITGWHRNPPRRLVHVQTNEGSSIECTEDHKILTARGYVSASSLQRGDELFSAPSRVFVSSPDIALPELEIEVAPHIAASNAVNCGLAHAKLNSKDFGRISMPSGNLTNHPFVQMRRAVFERAVSLAVRNILRASSILKIAQRWISSVAAVTVSNLLSFRTRTNESLHDHLVTESIHGFPVNAHGDARVSFVQDWLQKPFFDGMVPIGPHSREAFDAPKVGYHVSSRRLDDREPCLVRSVTLSHSAPPSTYCLSIADNHNMLIDGGARSIVCKNCIDDPHNTETEKVIETDADRNKVASWFKEVRSTRLNDPKQSAIVVVMQRLHQQDLSGVILDSDDEDYVHLMIPMEFDESRRTPTIILPQYDYDGEPEPWTDPRSKDGELMWPERFGRKEVERMKGIMGPYMASGRLQQSPVPKGGGIILDTWWQLWDQQEAQRYGLEWNGALKEFPPFELVVGSLDTAYGEKQENDYNAMTVWGVWIDRNRNRRAMLMFAWNKRLKLNGRVIAQMPNEAKVNYMARQKEEWGLVELVADTCKRYKVKRMLIEDKSRGKDVANELNRLYARENWGVELLPVSGDKVSRTHVVVPLFTDNAIWAPNTKWAQAVINQCATFPKDTHDDMHDTVTQFLNWAREHGIIERADESSAALEDQMRPKGHDGGVAAQYGVG